MKKLILYVGNPIFQYSPIQLFRFTKLVSFYCLFLTIFLSNAQPIVAQHMFNYTVAGASDNSFNGLYTPNGVDPATNEPRWKHITNDHHIIMNPGGGSCLLCKDNNTLPSCNSTTVLCALKSGCGTEPLPQTGWIVFGTICSGTAPTVTSSVLPVEMTYFEVQKIDKGSRLVWQTASEINNSGFEIEHGLDGRIWKMIDFIPGHGTTLEKQTYSYIDEKPMPGTNYYRLRQVDFDGQYEYSKTVSVEVSKTRSDLSLFPNPANGSVTLAFESGYTGEATLTLYDLLGKQMKTQLLPPESGAFRTRIDLSGLPNGMYLAEVQAGREKWQERLVVEWIFR